jgi:DNA-binding NtrC family response regulator
MYHWDRKEDFQTAKAKVIERFESEILSAALREHQGNVSRAARALGLHRQNVQQKLRRLGLSTENFKDGG